MKKVIYFCRHPQKNGKHSFNKKYAVFSNFTLSPIKFKGRVYPSGEHLFQALKHSYNPSFMEEIRKAATKKTNKPSPAIAKKLGRKYRLTKDQIETWNKVKYKKMLQVLEKKFTQNKEMGKILKDTKNAELKENAPWDSWWGIGKNEKGKNMLGKALMEIRDKRSRSRSRAKN